MTQIITTAELIYDADRVLFKQVCFAYPTTVYIISFLFALTLTYDIGAVFTNSHLLFIISLKILSYTYPL